MSVSAAATERNRKNRRTSECPIDVWCAALRMSVRWVVCLFACTAIGPNPKRLKRLLGGDEWDGLCCWVSCSL